VPSAAIAPPDTVKVIASSMVRTAEAPFSMGAMARQPEVGFGVVGSSREASPEPC